MIDALETRFRDAMRRTASGVAVLTTDGPAGRAGVTVSTLCSLSMEPPSVIACVHRASRALPTILDNGAFAANVLAQDQRRVAESFAGQIPEFLDDRFAVGTWSALTTGAPALEDALAGFDCRIAQIFDFGSHRMLIGQVVDVRARDEVPLIYCDRAFQQLAAA
jgi:flavin reductase (DIM6/NTAB) family NADH-FMN oxidoreductase RutF